MTTLRSIVMTLAVLTNAFAQQPAEIRVPSEGGGCPDADNPRSAQSIRDKLARASVPCIRVNFEFLEITSTATTNVRTRGSAIVEDGGEGSMVLAVAGYDEVVIGFACTIIEGKGIRMRIYAAGSVVKTVVVKNFESVVIPVLEGRSTDSRVAVKLTPSVEASHRMKEEPIDPSSRVRILAGMLVRNGKEVLRDGGGIEVDAGGVFGFTSANGTMVMALHPFCDAVRDGYIDGHRLYAAIDDTYYTWTSREPILQADGLHGVWVLRLTSAQMDEWGPPPGSLHAGGQVIIFAWDEPPECSGR